MEKGLEGELSVWNSLLENYLLETACWRSICLKQLAGHVSKIEDAHRVFEELAWWPAIRWLQNMLTLGILELQMTWHLLIFCLHAAMQWMCPQDGCYYLKALSDYGHEQCVHGWYSWQCRTENLVLKLPSQLDWGVCITLLGSRAKHGNLESGRRVFDFFVKPCC